MSDPSDIDPKEIPGSILRQSSIEEFPDDDDFDAQCKIVITLISFILTDAQRNPLALYRILLGFLEDDELFPFLMRLQSAIKTYEKLDERSDEVLAIIQDEEKADDDPPVRH